MKPLIIKDHITHMGYANLSDTTLNSYRRSKKTWKWMKKCFFHLFNLTILNTSCAGNMTHLKFWEQLLRDLVVLSHKENTELCSVPRGQHSSSETQINPPAIKHFLHWSTKGKRHHVPNEETKQKKKVYYCKKCDCGLCAVPCFELWHTKNQL
jgi:hypothetical protein